MTSPRAEKFFYTLQVAIALTAVTGMILLLLQARSAELALFELVTFGVSITAVSLATLGAINNIRQTRALRLITREMREAITELRDIDKDNEAIRRRVNQDYVLVKDIAEALAESGLVGDEAERRAAAIEKKARDRIKH